MLVATWNVERLTPRAWKRGPIVREALSGRGHDVLVLTECHKHFIPREALSLVAHSEPAADRGVGELWVGIWVKRTLKARRLCVKGDPERTAAVLVSTDAARPVIVFGTVLPWRSDPRYHARGGAAAFAHALALQEQDIASLRRAHRQARFVLMGDFNQEVDAEGPVGTAVGHGALTSFLDRQGLIVATGGKTDPLMHSDRNWRRSIDHIALDAITESNRKLPVAWPDRTPLPSGWPDHYGVEVELTDL